MRKYSSRMYTGIHSTLEVTIDNNVGINYYV